MRVLVTRPADDVAPLAEQLTARGHQVLIEPLLTVSLFDGPALDLAGVQAILLTSANGARALARRTAVRELPVLAVGDATAAAARAAGFAQVASANGDVEDLARLARERLTPGSGPLLHAAGTVSAGDLAQRLGQAGFTLRREVLYRAEPVAALSEPIRAAFAASGVDAVLFFSPRTAATFVRLVRDARLEPHLRTVVAFALSAAVKAKAESLPWRAVETADRPTQAALLDLVDGWTSRQRGLAEVPMTERASTMTTPASAASSGTAPPAEPPRPQPFPERDSAHRSVASEAPAPRFGGPGGGPSQRNGPWFVAGVVLGLVGAGAAGWWMSERQRPGLAPDPGIAQLNLKLADLDRRMAALQSSAAGTEELARGLRPMNERLAAAEKNLAELQGKLNGVAADVGRAKTLGDELATVARRLAAVEQMIKSEADQRAATIAENRRIGQELARLQESVAAVAGAERAAAARIAELRRGDALLVAVTQLREALRRPGPYGDQVKPLQALAANDPVLAAALPSLAGRADRGVPTLDDLRVRFAAVAAAMVQAERVPPGDGWWEQALARLSSIVSIRRIGADVAGESAEAIAARAEARLAHGDLAGAVDALESVAGPPAQPLAAWLGDARARLSIDHALAELTVHAFKSAGAQP